MGDEKSTLQGVGSTKNLKDKIDLYANGRGWPAERYAALGLYVLMYNRLKNNRDKFVRDLTADPNGQYYEHDKNKRQEIINFFGKTGYCTDDTRNFIMRYARSYFNKEYNLRMTENEFGFFENEQQLMVLESQANDYARQIGRSGMLTVGDMRAICDLKIEDSRKVFEGYRKSVTEKGETNVQKKDDKLTESNGWAIDAFKKAKIELKQRKSASRRDGRHCLLYGLLGAGAAALTVTSFFTLVPFIGISFGLTGVAGVVAGLAGTIAGGILTKFGLGKAITKFAAWRKKRRDTIAWMKGEGKYMGSAKDAKSFKAIEYNKTYNTAVRNLFFNYKSLRAMERTFTDDYKKKNGIALNDTTYDADIRRLFVKEQEKIVKGCFKEAKINEGEFKNEYALQHPSATPDEIEKAYQDAKILRGTFSESKAKEIEVRILMQNEYVKPILKDLHAYGEPVVNGGYDQIMSLYEELKNNYESSADGVDFGKQSEAHFGRLAEVKSLLAHQPEEYISEERTPQTVQMQIEDMYREAKKYEETKEKLTPEGKLPDIEKLKELVNNLYELEDSFKKAHDETGFKKAKERLSEMVVSIYRKTLLEDGYSSTSIADIKNVLGAPDSNFKKLLESPGYGDNLDDIENIIAFMNAEGDTGSYPNGQEYRVAYEGLGVGYKNQLFIDKDHMLKGVKQIDPSLTPSNPRYSIIENAINQIDTMQYQSQKSSIETVITTIPSSEDDGKVKNYLSKMLENKSRECSVESLDKLKAKIGNDNIAQGISDLFKDGKEIDSAKVASIRELINNLTDDATKELATKLLDDQITANAIRANNLVRRGVFGSIENNNYHELQDKLKQISEIKEINPSSLKDMYNDINSPTKESIDPDVKKYLIQKLKNRVQRVFEQGSSDAKFNVTTSNKVDAVVGNLQQLIIDINTCVTNKCLDSWQKDQIFGKYRDKFDNAIEQYCKSAEKDILNPDGTYIKSAETMLKAASLGGLEEYFQLNTPKSRKAFERLKRIKYFSKANLFLTEGKTFGGNGIKYDGSNEMMSAMFSYFRQQRTDSDPLNKFLESMKSVYDNSGEKVENVENITALPQGVEWRSDSGVMRLYDTNRGKYVDYSDSQTASTVKCFNDPLKPDVTCQPEKSFVFQVMRELESAEYQSLNDQDKLIALTVLKRRTMAMAIAQIAGIRNRYHGADLEAFRGAMRGGKLGEIGDLWANLAKRIDYEIQKSKAVAEVSTPDFARMLNNTSDNLAACFSSVEKLNDVLNREQLYQK